MNARWNGLLLAILCTAGTAATDDVSKSMIAVIPVQSKEKDVNLTPNTELRAGDWVTAWQAARDTCPEPRDIRIFFKEHPGAGANDPTLYECLDIKARGQVLVIKVRKTDKAEESVILVPASEVLRLEIMKKSES